MFVGEGVPVPTLPCLLSSQPFSRRPVSAVSRDGQAAALVLRRGLAPSPRAAAAPSHPVPLTRLGAPRVTAASPGAPRGAEPTEATRGGGGLSLCSGLGFAAAAVGAGSPGTRVGDPVFSTTSRAPAE